MNGNEKNIAGDISLRTPFKSPEWARVRAGKGKFKVIHRFKPVRLLNRIYTVEPVVNQFIALV